MRARPGCAGQPMRRPTARRRTGAWTRRPGLGPAPGSSVTPIQPRAWHAIGAVTGLVVALSSVAVGCGAPAAGPPPDVPTPEAVVEEASRQAAGVGRARGTEGSE